jgi:hypothetical protein
MCDYSLAHVKSRPASVGDRLRTSNFGTGTRGFAAPEDPSTAVCVLPGTELAFNSDIRVYGAADPMPHKTAIFRQVNREQPHMHHDALELPDGHTILLTFLCEGQEATVLQLPAKPATKEAVSSPRRSRGSPPRRSRISTSCRTPARNAAPSWSSARRRKPA